MKLLFLASTLALAACSTPTASKPPSDSIARLGFEYTVSQTAPDSGTSWTLSCDSPSDQLVGGSCSADGADITTSAAFLRDVRKDPYGSNGWTCATDKAAWIHVTLTCWSAPYDTSAK